jgi:hypothetical protein
MADTESLDALGEAMESSESSLAELAFEQVARDISLFSNREIEVDGVQVERGANRPRAAGEIHISFKVAFLHGGEAHFGSLFIPLSEALTLASLLLLKERDVIDEIRTRTGLDQELKDAVLEIGNLVGGALDNALRWFLPAGYSVRAASCQGVRESMPPWLDNPPGTRYIVARTRARIDEFPWGEWSLVIPDLFDLGE